MVPLQTHRELGRELGLFLFDEASPGSAFFLPDGAVVYNGLVEFMRGHYARRGYSEVVTPNLYCETVWKRSGHWDKYRENIFSLEPRPAESANADSTTAESEAESADRMSLKPMNCPGHCVLFKRLQLSYKELPQRWAEFGVLHRNELSGTLSGLTRVRRFQQDDAHIFCRADQVEAELEGCIDFLKDVYLTFGFDYRATLSTRPDKYIGSEEQWERAETALREKIAAFPAWEIQEGGGAFYGPKIDITINDSHGRAHQCGTIQLDFNLPARLGLRYKTAANGEEQPVLIHRAVLGSLERFVAILLEHTGGRLPFWLAPRQICVIPVAAKYAAYAETVKERFGGFRVDVDASCSTLSKKIRSALSRRYCLLFVVGARECNDDAVSVREGTKNVGVMTVAAAKAFCRARSAAQ